MKCKKCGTEMLRDGFIEGEMTKTFFYKCPNPNCVNYGYKKKEEAGNLETESSRGDCE